jgi:hypothetical protein
MRVPYKEPICKILRLGVIKKLCFCRSYYGTAYEAYLKAEKKLSQELDVVTILKRLRRVDVLTNILVHSEQ